jgi:DNA-binding GntR family transcriptional regulator
VNEFVVLDQAFHTRFVSLAANSELNRVYQRLHVHMHISRLYFPSATIDLGRTMKEHQEILDAAEARAASRLRQAVRMHISRVRGFIAEALTPDG